MLKMLHKVMTMGFFVRRYIVCRYFGNMANLSSGIVLLKSSRVKKQHNHKAPQYMNITQKEASINHMIQARGGVSQKGRLLVTSPRNLCELHFWARLFITISNLVCFEERVYIWFHVGVQMAGLNFSTNVPLGPWKPK